MNQKSEYIILPLKSDQIIRKAIGVDPDFNTSNQLGYRPGQSMIRFADIFHQPFRSRSLRPI